MQCRGTELTAVVTGTTMRLADSGNPLQGRLEVLYRGVWGTVCDNNFDDNAAKVACYTIGFGYDFIVLSFLSFAKQVTRSLWLRVSLCICEQDSSSRQTYLGILGPTGVDQM